MADIAKTIAIILQADTKDAETKLAEISKSIGDLGKVDGANLAGASKSIDAVGTAAGGAAKGTKELGDGLRKLAEDAGIPEPALKSLDGILGKIGGVGGGTAVVAAAAVAALAITFGKIGLDANKFKTSLDNVSGGAIDSEKALQFVVDVTKRIESNLNDTLDAYEKFTRALLGSEVPAAAVNKAFEGILKAVEGVGGSSADAQKALDTFTRVAFDGQIKLKEFDDIARDIPGGLRILADAVGVPADKLREVAAAGGLGKEAIEAFAEALAKQQYDVVGIGGITNAFNDLLTTIKLVGLELGADKDVNIGLFLIEKAIRAVTLSTTLVSGAMVALIQTLGNVAKTLKTLDFAGFDDRQVKIFENLAEKIALAGGKLIGFNDAGKQTNVATVALADSSEKWVDSLGKAQGPLDGLSDQIIKTSDETLKFADATNSLVDASKKWIDNLDQVQQPLGGLSDQILKSSKETLTFGDSLKEASGSSDFLVGATRKLLDGTKDISAIYDATTGKLIGYENAQKKAADTSAKSTAQIDKQREATERYQLKLKELENDLRGKIIEAQVKLNVAQIEADTKRIEAAFNSINSVIGDTNDLIGNLFGILANPNLEWAQIRAIEDQINEENDIKKGQLALQKALTEAQIANLNAQTKNLEKGDALIKVDGAGLQPHLEGFMWEILRTIQVRANRDGRALLLGV